MSSPLDSAQSSLSALNSAVNSGDVDGGKRTLASLKIAMLDFPSGPSMTAAHLAVATGALECGVLLSVADEDLDAFARNVAQIKPYYAALAGMSEATSERKCHILGLNLMHLLVDNRLSEFHAELELLTEAEASTKYVSFPIELERQLMVGSYDEVLNANSRIPDPSYGFFMDNLLQTVRDSIADCLEVSYKTMTLEDAVRMMKYGSVEELREYIEECRDDWIVEGGSVVFQPPPVGSKASDVPSMKLIGQSLSYATELERIV
uniref:PCI domain-containing protein n=1 Tax=Pseudictyota dubia TaxID=2749911 RepID=A0A6U2A0U7_9STRA